MKLWIAALVVWYALLAAGWLVVRDVDSRASQPPPTDWERAAICVWERWDAIQYMTYEQTGRILRFCVQVEPHSLTPGLPPPR